MMSPEERLKLLMEPCQTIEELDAFIQGFLGIELPWDFVDEDSTSAPLRFIWDVYHTLLTGKGPTRHVVAASRNSMKTLGSSIIQFLSMLHFRRDGVHIAAILDQSLTSIRYLDQYLSIPELAPYRIIDNIRTKKLINLPANSYTKKSDAVLRVVTATKKGANSPRASCLDGRSVVLAPSSKGASREYSMEGIWRRFNKGEDIEIYSFNPITCEREVSKVVNAVRRENLERLKITTKSGKSIICTKDHYLSFDYDSGGIRYCQAEELIIGDNLLVKADNSATSPSKYDKVYNELAKHIHPDYRYKLKKTPKPCSSCGKKFWFDRNVKNCGSSECWFDEFQSVLVKDEIVSIEPYMAKENSRNRWVYDISLDKNFNFSANGIITHNCLTYDEVDLLDRSIISESAYISDPTRDGHARDPMYIYLSSRKSNEGPIQDLITKAEEAATNPNIQARIKLHKWSTVDFMQKCEPEVHLPEQGPQKAYLHTETLETVWGEENFKAKVSTNTIGQYKEISAFEGCKTCPAWIACQARSVKQRGLSPTLRTVTFVGDVLEAVGDAQVIIAQSLNWKPESTALVFKTFSYHKNAKDPIDFYEWITGARYNPFDFEESELDRIMEEGTMAEIVPITPTKLVIYQAMLERGYRVCYGVDWGFSPDPAVVIVLGYHSKLKRCAILHVESANNYANQDWAQYVADNVWAYMPGEHLAPDMADPASPTYFYKNHIPCLETKPPRIETGVSFIRSLLWNPITQSTGFCILDDSPSGQNKMMINEFLHWTHKKTAMGWDFNKYEENKWNHTIDSLRYALDPFVKDISITIRGTQPKTEAAQSLHDHTKRMQFVAKEEGVDKINKFLSENFGLGNVFSKEQQLQAFEEARRFNEKIVGETEAISEVVIPSKSSLKFKF